MMNYTMTQGVSMFDTCYNFSGCDTVEVLTISFVFGGNVEVPIPSHGILIGSQELACLAFAGNSDASDVGTFGNWQQQTLDVVHDVAGGKLGFGTGGFPPKGLCTESPGAFVRKVYDQSLRTSFPQTATKDREESCYVDHSLNVLF
ncbi:hypothetical protein RHSIM_Rhsim02G0219700 [Rhododendron simsii]|uniref:Peptidase A1 domain-containing protein n=1 Tax=Rhododendron simsii TaxID=118357 RepID=A0A834HFI2_RHOSS|nr:hypothetical protein RHSIM_Rhsim02G0219700 [Rhododendron simsii]